MSVSDSFLTFVLEQLDGLSALMARRMFGGVGIYSGDVFFAVIDNDTLFFKVDDGLRRRYVEAGMPPFAPIPNKPPMMGYYQVPLAVLEDADELKRWAEDSLKIRGARVHGARSPGPRRRSRRSRKA
jgi:DNA transformation protein